MHSILRRKQNYKPKREDQITLTNSTPVKRKRSSENTENDEEDVRLSLVPFSDVLATSNCPCSTPGFTPSTKCLAVIEKGQLDIALLETFITIPMFFICILWAGSMESQTHPVKAKSKSFWVKLKRD
ncbi:hypothetical protein BC938DRAFT_473038 [Jimgerdemannia flammicorona]|uniref:Uncharacterized protein n=1 Tax=Jimgerdemannia flammicorona TaxID=994334 RepID=A0A433Q4R6_9FUNG|nr:hypothetical protein BC938DRAFT_473038 [Jimgerdemannia flammicorona]